MYATKVNVMNDGSLKIIDSFLSTELSEIGFEYDKTNTIYTLPLRVIKLEDE
jgi:hypothetical protein